MDPNSGLAALANVQPHQERHAAVSAGDLEALIGDMVSSTSQTISSHQSQGQFRTRCQYSHLAYDDPLVHPGKPGGAHLHMFFGNTAVNAHTTHSSLVNSGGGSCDGQALNRTGYWIPALLDGQGGVRVPYDIVVYYKTSKPGEVRRMPQGLGIIAGDGKNTSTELSHNQPYWACGRRDVTTVHSQSRTIPNCPTDNGDKLLAFVPFPECWNGQLRSADNKSHMSFPMSGSCPSTHPIRLPKITINFLWRHEGTSSTWHLSSDQHGSFVAPSGTTLHADWWGGWNDTVMDTWTKNCTSVRANCHVSLIENNRRLRRLSSSTYYEGPDVLTLPTGTHSH